MADLSLITGPVPVVVLVLGVLAAVALLVRRGRPGLVAAGVAVAVALVLLVGLNPLVVDVLGLLPEELPTPVVAWVAVAAAAVVLAVAGLVGTPLWRKPVALVCGLLVLLTSGSQINSYFAAYPTVGALAGDSTDAITVFPGKAARLQSAAQPQPVVHRWNGPAGAGSRIYTATVPGTASGFTGRDAYLYLPAAYTGPNPPLLPVLVLVAGQPGAPEDWVVGGQLQLLMDGFAARHGGLAPVTVVVDPNGAEQANTMCMDSDLAKADTYLSQDVPAWLTEHVGVDTDHSRWAFGGWSFGGTCALQMATRHPDLYPSFIDVAGEREPAISADRGQTVQDAFGGDTAAFDALVPLTLLGQQRYPQVWGFFAAGGDEQQVGSWTTEVSTAAQRAGMTVRTQVVPGQGHSWAVPQAVLVPALEWLGPRMGIIG